MDRPPSTSCREVPPADLAREIAADGTWRKVLTLTESDREALLEALRPALAGRDDTLAHGTIRGIGRALKAAGITPAAIRERSRSQREQLTYRPSARLAEIVRARDGVCRFPGCNARAVTCDLDHTVPFDHEHPNRGGLTVEQNLACLCRRHHRLKTLGLWKVRQLGGGRLEWTTPGGDLVVTEPAGAFSAPDRAAEEALAAAHGLELIDPLTLERLFGTHHGTGVQADLRYILDAQALPIAVIDTSVPITILDGSDEAALQEWWERQHEPAPF